MNEYLNNLDSFFPATKLGEFSGLKQTLSGFSLICNFDLQKKSMYTN
jgi:hypothetical protein